MVKNRKRGEKQLLLNLSREILGEMENLKFKGGGEGFMCDTFSSPYLCFDSNLAVQNESGGPKSLIA